mgnify:CR=1 FL=1
MWTRFFWFFIVTCVGVLPVHGAARNVLLLVADDHGLELGCYGHPVIKTPSLDRLAGEGVRFANAYATVASCSASRSVILTGLQNHTNGQFGHQHGYNNLHTFGNVKSLPALLNDAGYRTAVLGKLHVQPPEVYPFSDVLNVKGGARSVARMAEAAEAYFKTDPDTPFFLLVGYVDPHRARVGFGNEDYPGVEPVKYKPEDVIVPPFLPDLPEARAELAEYYESVSRLDQGVGLMLDALERSGRANDTLVIYISDNGIAFPGAKTTLYEPGIHLPMIVRSPDQKEQGRVNRAMVSWVDIAPTILDWANVTTPKQMQGRSVLDILNDDDPAGWDEVFASHTFHEITMYYPMRVIRTRRYKYILNLAHPLPFPFASDLYDSPIWQAVLDQGVSHYGRRSVDAYVNRPREELYDLYGDPNEAINLADDTDHAETLSDLRDRLKAWQERTNDPWILKYRYE